MLNNKIIKENRRYQSKGKMRYGSQSYSNPFFQKKKNAYSQLPAINFELTIKARMFAVGFLLLLMVLGWALFYSSFFAIKHIEVAGGGKISPDTVEAIARQQIESNFVIIFPQKNIFFFSKDRMKKTLEDKYVFNNLEIIKDYPDTLHINYQEKEYELIWQENDHYYYANSDGNIISEVNLLEISEKDYPIINNVSSDTIFNKKISIDLAYVDLAIWLFDKCKEQNLIIERFIKDQELNTLKIKLKDGPEIYFSIEMDRTKQFDKLLIIKNERLKEQFNSKTYIDLRMGDSVYFR